jgi:hypothetical protein
MITYGKPRIFAVVLTGLLLLGWSTQTQVKAIEITPGDFGPSAVFESFEGLSAGTNIPSAGAGYLEPGVIEPFNFNSGVTLTWPIPNPGIREGVIVGDWSIGGAHFGLASNGSIDSAADVPFGTAYLALDAPEPQGPIELTFPSDILRVGAYVTASSLSGPITLSVFDTANHILETATISPVNVSLWGNNFLGIENTGGIRKIQFSGRFEVLDGLTSEVPEPTTICLLGLGALSLVSRKTTKISK